MNLLLPGSGEKVVGSLGTFRILGPGGQCECVGSDSVSANFYREKFVLTGRSILLLDSLHGGNRAGFHWDYANPPGVDTIRVFASTDRQLTNRIRQSVGSSGQSGLNQGVIVGKPLAQLVSLRQELIGGMTRGLITVPDEPMVEPAVYENPPSAELPYSQ
ncbi:MAG: hypothetical protein OET79_13620, partial [Nitrospirota bacterium]|nr:hypothetical protein [Nitrospirota bacterium]